MGNQLIRKFNLCQIQDYFTNWWGEIISQTEGKLFLIRKKLFQHFRTCACEIDTYPDTMRKCCDMIKHNTRNSISHLKKCHVFSFFRKKKVGDPHFYFFNGMSIFFYSLCENLYFLSAGRFCFNTKYVILSHFP